MRSVARSIHMVVAWLAVVALVVQVWLAGRGVFDTSAGFDIHRDLGYTIGLVPLVLLVLGLLGGMGRRVALLAVAMFVLNIVQSVLVLQRESNPSIAALHPVNGFLILLLAIVLALDSSRMRTAPA
jgi:mercuric ion transport protein